MITGLLPSVEEGTNAGQRGLENKLALDMQVGILRVLDVIPINETCFYFLLSMQCLPFRERNNLFCYI